MSLSFVFILTYNFISIKPNSLPKLGPNVLLQSYGRLIENFMTKPVLINGQAYID